jgi:hypothetical protein
VAELRPATRTVAVEAGDLEVTACAGAASSAAQRASSQARRAPLRVQTGKLSVELTQAHVVFAAGQVRVVSGEVHIYSLDDHLLATVPAGQSWPPAAPAPRRAPVPAAVAPAPTATAPASVAAAPRPVSAGAALLHARSALADGDAPLARRWLERALAAAPSAHDRAEAALFEAESYLVEHQPARAVGAYRRAAEAWAQTPEGEAAAFAAAQVLSEMGAPEAHQALGAYLSRYPAGRFAGEARALFGAPARPSQ